MEDCAKLAEVRKKVEERRWRNEWRTRHSRDKKKKKGGVGVEKEKEKEEGEKIESFFCNVYEFPRPRYSSYSSYSRFCCCFFCSR